MSDVTETIARAMQESAAWPAVFGAGSAETLARAAITALEAQGYAIVPIEPTEEMWDAAMREGYDQDPFTYYRAMISTGKAKA